MQLPTILLFGSEDVKISLAVDGWYCGLALQLIRQLFRGMLNL